MEERPSDQAFIFGLPKAELHVHLEGSMGPELYNVIARRNGLRTPYGTAEDVRQRLRDALDLGSFIAIYEELIGAIRESRDFRDIALDYLRTARAQGVLYAEISFDPQLHVERGVSLATICAGLLEAQREAWQKLGVEACFIVSFLRDRPAEEAMRLLDELRPWIGSLVIGIGLDNPEVHGFPEKFQGVYAKAGELGLRKTSHCDVDQPNTVAHHWGVIEQLNVERIDHGLNVLDDPALIETVRQRRIGLTGAPTLFHTDIAGRMERRAGAIKRLLEEGLLITLNSDDPGMKRGLYVGDLMLRAQRSVGFTRAQIVQLARNSFTIAWLDVQRQRDYQSRIDAYLATAGETAGTVAIGG